MNTVCVRNVEIGAGIPKICVPIVGQTKEEIIAEAQTFHSIPADVAEWRADWFEGVFDCFQVLDVLQRLREALGEIPLLFTFRTAKEGGEKSIEPEAYALLNFQAIQSGYVDLVDVEALMGDEIVRTTIDVAHAAGVKVVASSHDFSGTPDQADLVDRLRKMQDLGADLTRQLEEACLGVYEKCYNYAYDRGIIIADTKLEFGLDEAGDLVLADEVLTPDSSRFWNKAEYQVGTSPLSYDKQYLRDWLTDNKLAGVTPAPDLPAEVVEKTQQKYLECLQLLVPQK